MGRARQRIRRPARALRDQLWRLDRRNSALLSVRSAGIRQCRQVQRFRGRMHGRIRPRRLEGPGPQRSGRIQLSRAARKQLTDAAAARKTPRMPPILALEKISKRFGAVVVAQDIDLVAPEGQALGIIGPNGAGKTTLFGIMTGTVRPDAGRVMFACDDITRLTPERPCRRGSARP